MKHLRYTLLAVALAGGPALAQHATTAQSGFVPASAPSTAPAHAAAVQALTAFAEDFSHRPGLPPGFPLAVTTAADLAQARIGWGLAVYDVEPASLQSGVGLEAGARPIGQWRYEVLLRGRPVGLLTLADTGQGWQAVSFGGAGLGTELDALVTRYGAQAGTRLRYVRVPQATADFIEVKQGAAAARYAPLHAARSSLHLATPDLRDDTALMPALRDAVARNVAVMH